MKKKTFKNSFDWRFQLFSLERYDSSTWWTEYVAVSESFEFIIEKAQRISYENEVDLVLYERTAEWIWYSYDWKQLDFKYWESKINYTDQQRVWIRWIIFATFKTAKEAELFTGISEYCDICLKKKEE